MMYDFVVLLVIFRVIECVYFVVVKKFICKIYPNK